MVVCTARLTRFIERPRAATIRAKAVSLLAPNPPATRMRTRRIPSRVEMVMTVVLDRDRAKVRVALVRGTLAAEGNRGSDYLEWKH